MANKFTVWSIFKAKDDVSKAFKKMSTNSKRFGNGAEAAFKKASRGARGFESLTSSILKAGLVTKGLSLIKEGVSEVASQFIQFDDAIVASSAKFKDIKLATDEGKASLAALKKQARETGAATQFSATQAAQGLDFLAMAGFTSAQAIATLPGIVDLATVASVDLARATDIASDSLGAFGLMTEDNIQLQKNMNRVNDVFAKTMTTANASMEDMFEAVKKGAPDFTAAGQSIETFSALVGVMANSGVKGSEAGTKLRNMMTRLAKPTKEAQEVIDKLGVKLADQNGNFRNAIDIVRDFEKALKKKGNVEKGNILSTVFGTRTQGALNILIKEGTDKLRIYEKTLMAAGGSARQMADIMRDSLGNRIKSLQSALIELGFAILGNFKGNFVDAIESATEAARGFDVKPVVQAITSIFEIMRDLKEILPVITALVLWQSRAWAIATAKMIFFEGISLLATGALWMMSTAMSALAVATTLSVGQWVALAIVIIGVIAIIWSQWGKVSDFIITKAMAVWNIFKNIIKLAKQLGGGVINFVFGRKSEDFNRSSSLSNDSVEVFRPPNRTDEETRRVQFDAMFKFENAPDGLRVETKTQGAPQIPLIGLGAN